jgi:hypothetical protein
MDSAPSPVKTGHGTTVEADPVETRGHPSAEPIGSSIDLSAVARMRRNARNGTARATRELHGLSVGEVARKLGVTTPTVSLWERGLRQPSAEHAEQWDSILRSLGQ